MGLLQEKYLNEQPTCEDLKSPLWFVRFSLCGLLAYIPGGNGGGESVIGVAYGKSIILHTFCKKTFVAPPHKNL
jgi:hypothetical protein